MGDEVPIRVEMDRDHRLEFENVLRAVVRPEPEVGVVLKRQDEVADRILRFFRDRRLVGFADGIVGDGLVVVGLRLLGVRGRAGEQRGPNQSREPIFCRVLHYSSTPLSCGPPNSRGPTGRRLKHARTKIRMASDKAIFIGQMP